MFYLLIYSLRSVGFVNACPLSALYRCIHEGGPAHAKRFTYSVRVNTTDRGWTDDCVGEPMPSVKKAKDSAAVLLLELLNRWYAQS